MPDQPEFFLHSKVSSMFGAFCDSILDAVITEDKRKSLEGFQDYEGWTLISNHVQVVLGAWIFIYQLLVPAHFRGPHALYAPRQLALHI